MSFLARLFRRSAPQWASFLTGDAYAAFEAALHADLRARGWRFHQDADGITVEDPADGRPLEFGLTNLAQVCGGTDRSSWPEIIHEHFDRLLALRGETDDVESWEAARPVLKLRLFGPEQAQLEGMVTFPVGPGITAVLAMDLPTTVRVPRPGSILDWPPVDELHAIALDNVRAEPAPVVETIGDPPGQITVLAGDSFFVATRLLILPEAVDLAGAAHALVAVPNRHTLMVLPIRDPAAIGAMSLFVQIAVKLHREGPGSIVPTVFWWHGGALTPIPARFDGKGVEVWPPDEFMELLNALAPTKEA